MDAAPIPPKRKRRGRARVRKNRRSHLPPEMVEEILLNLPVKSLLRFSSVCKSWNSLIWEPRFTRIHKSRSVLLRRNRLVIYMNFLYGVPAFTAFSSIPSNLQQKVIKLETNSHHFSYVSFSFDSEGPIERMIEYFAGQFKKKPYLRALCDELWCVEAGKHLFLWNPSIRNYRTLPPPLFKFQNPKYENKFLYGLAYDSVGDDYKILKIPIYDPVDPSVETELYSVKNNCWRKIESYSSYAEPTREQERCEFLNGRFHWIGIATAKAKTPAVIVSFNLSTEKYEELALPQYSENFDQIEVVVLRGKLCVCLNYCDDCRFEIWLMEEYAVEKSWTKKFDFRRCDDQKTIKPVYYYDNGDILVTETEFWSTAALDLVLYKKEKCEIKSNMIVKNSNRDPPYYNADAFLYVETLISPTALYNVDD